MPGSRCKNAAKKRQKVVQVKKAGFTLVDDSAYMPAPNRRKFIKIVGISAVSAALWREAVALESDLASSSNWFYGSGFYSSGSWDIEGVGYGAMPGSKTGPGMTSSDMQLQNESNWCVFAVAISILHWLDPADRRFCFSPTAFTNVQCVLARDFYLAFGYNCCDFKSGGDASDISKCNQDVTFGNAVYIFNALLRKMKSHSQYGPTWMLVNAECNTSLSVRCPVVFGVKHKYTHIGHCACIRWCDAASAEVWIEDPAWGWTYMYFTDILTSTASHYKDFIWGWTICTQP